MRRAKLLLLRAARAAGAFAVARRLTRRGVRILCYHGTWRAEDGFRGDAMFMHPDTFRQRLATIRRLGYPVVALEQAVAALRGEISLADGSVAITIDDGWYGTYADMLPELQRQQMPATLYCDSAHVQSCLPVPHVMARWLRRTTGGKPISLDAEQALSAAIDRSMTADSRMAAMRRFADLAGIDAMPYESTRAFDYMTPDELRDAASRGLDVQLHTHNHTLGDLSARAVTAEIMANRAALAEMLPDGGVRRHFCYPSGECSEASAAALSGIGVRSATTTEQGIAWRGMNPWLLPRLLDGEQMTQLEFEAELSGFADILRRLRRWLKHPIVWPRPSSKWAGLPAAGKKATLAPFLGPPAASE
jgi:peptidoglycan/xylan/chitin deacetylase (PgdA/CDA1 family)